MAPRLAMALLVGALTVASALASSNSVLEFKKTGGNACKMEFDGKTLNTTCVTGDGFCPSCVDSLKKRVDDLEAWKTAFHNDVTMRLAALETATTSAYPTASPTAYPTAHPCDDGTHSCDKNGGGICYETGGGDWACACASGYYCAAGCAAPHVGHECVAETSNPTPMPTANPTPAYCSFNADHTMAACDWGEGQLTWPEVAAKAADVMGTCSGTSSGCWRLCKVSEYYSRCNTISSSSVSGGFLWGNARNCYWGESAHDISSYACQNNNGQCHTDTEFSNARGYGNSCRICSSAGCGNGVWAPSGSFCNYGHAPHTFGPGQMKSSGGYYCQS